MSSLQRGTVLSVSLVRVVDGDTVRVRRRGLFSWLFRGGDIVVRLHGIDAPESAQKHGSASTKAMARLLRGSGLRLEVTDTDRYGRTVGLLYHSGSGRDRSANLRLVEEGWAFAYTRYGGSELGFGAAERDASAARRGMWTDARIRRGLDRPWEFRARERASASRLRGLRWLLRLVFALFAVALACGFALVAYRFLSAL